MIQAEELYRILHCKPFQPFSVHLKDGRIYEVRFEHLAVVGKSFFDIWIPEQNSNDPMPYADYPVTVYLQDIDRLENLENSSQSAS
jgi:hypothetical protein